MTTMTDEGRIGGRARAVVTRHALAPMLSVASQGIGAVQLLLLLLRVRAGELTDAFFYIWGIGMLPTLTLVSGVVYPMLINQKQISLKMLKCVLYIALIGSVLCVSASYWWLFHSGRASRSVAVIAILMSVFCFVQCLVWFRATLAAAGGSASWLSGVALLPNCLAVGALLLPLSNAFLIHAMIVSLIVGNVIMLLWMRIRDVGRAELSELSARGGSGEVSATAWFFVRSGTGQGTVGLLQSTAVLLPPSQLTASTVIIKIVGSASVTVASALLPRFVNTQTDTADQARKFMRILWILWFAAGATACAAAFVFLREYFAIVVLASLWLCGSSTALVAQRIAFRFYSASISSVTIVTGILVSAATVLLVLTVEYNLTLLLCLYAMLECLSGLLLLVLMRDVLASCVMFSITIALIAIGGLSLV